ncbi:MAG: hypothetical protein INR71_12580 [Terriglobus roseus]|nr:hypothetical protein [Terriglobus roseus]
MSPSVLPMTPESQPRANSKEKSKKKDKDRSEKHKSSKKRQRDGDDDHDGTASARIRDESPSKRARTSAEPTKEYLMPAADRNGDDSPICEQTASFYLPLSPISLGSPVKGLCAEHLSPLILTYYPPLDGIVLSYRNARVSERPPAHGARAPSSASPSPLARQVDEYAASFAWATADVLLLRLRRGACADAVVNLQSEGRLGLVVWNLFSASVPRARLPADWAWREGPGDGAGGGAADDGEAGEQHGHFVDGEGKRVPRQVSFRIVDFEAAPAAEGDRGFVSIEGSLLSEEEDAALDKEGGGEGAKEREGQRGTARRSGGMGQDWGVRRKDRTGESSGNRKHRVSY